MATLYTNLTGALVGNSKVESIQQHLSVPARYRIRHYAGKSGNGHKYSDKTTIIDFAHQEEKLTPGLLPEQLVLVIKDFLAHQEDPNQAQIDACNKFLEASSM